MNLKNYIQLRPEGDLIRYDLAPLLANDEALTYAQNELFSFAQGEKLTAILGIGGTGMMLGSALANQLKLPFYSLQKNPLNNLEGKDFECVDGRDYALVIGENDLNQYDAVLILDDLVSSGQTMQSACNLVRKHHAQVVGVCAIIELENMGAREKLSAENLFTLIKF